MPFIATFGFAQPPSYTVSDLFSAVFSVCVTSGDLTLAFGRATWLWHDLAPPQTPIPFGVWSTTGEQIEQEARGLEVAYLSRGQHQLTVYGTSRAQARVLCRQVVRVIEEAAQAGSITFGESTLLFLRRTQTGFDQLDPERGRDGSDIWSHTILLESLTAEVDT